jgi:hypothetical protein
MINKEEIYDQSTEQAKVDALLDKQVGDTGTEDRKNSTGRWPDSSTLQMGVGVDSNSGGMDKLSGSGNGMVRPDNLETFRASSQDNGRVEDLDRGLLEPIVELTGESMGGFVLPLGINSLDDPSGIKVQKISAFTNQQQVLAVVAVVGTP